MGDPPTDSDDQNVVPPSTTYSVAMTANAPVVPFFEAQQQAAAATIAANEINLEDELINVWQVQSEPVEPIPGLRITPP